MNSIQSIDQPTKSTPKPKISSLTKPGHPSAIKPHLLYNGHSYPHPHPDSFEIVPSTQFTPVQNNLVSIDANPFIRQKESLVPIRNAVVPNQEILVPNRDPLVPIRDAVVPNRDPSFSNVETLVPYKDTFLPIQNGLVPNRESLGLNGALLAPNVDPLVPEIDTTGAPQKSAYSEEVLVSVKSFLPFQNRKRRNKKNKKFNERRRKKRKQNGRKNK